MPSKELPQASREPGSSKAQEGQPSRVETTVEAGASIDRSARVVNGIGKLLKRASSGASLRTASLLRMGSLLIALGAGTAGTLREAQASRIQYPDVGGIDLPEGEEIAVHPDQRLAEAQKFLEAARVELEHLQEQEEMLRGHEENPDEAFILRRKLQDNLRRQEFLISRIAQKEALVDQLSQTLIDEEAQRVERLGNRSEHAQTHGREERARKLSERASIRLYGTANAQVDAYMASVGIREEGRRIMLLDEAGDMRAFDIAPGMQPDGFYLDERKDALTIVFESPVGYYGFFLKDGRLYQHGACTEDGDPLSP